MANIFTLEGVKIIPVNMVAVMGAGLAKQAKVRDNALYTAYVKWCGLYDLNSCHDARNYIFVPLQVKTEIDDYLLFPTKIHWNRDSFYSLIEDMCYNMSTNRDLYKSKLYLFPKIGCGLGGLEWIKVKEILDRDLAWLPKEYV